MVKLRKQKIIVSAMTILALLSSSVTPAMAGTTLAHMSDADVTPDFWKDVDLPMGEFSVKKQVALIDSQICLAIRRAYDEKKAKGAYSKTDPNDLIHLREFFTECARKNKTEGLNKWKVAVPLPSLDPEKAKEIQSNPTKRDSLKKILSEGFNKETNVKSQYLTVLSAGLLLLLSRLPDDVTNWNSSTFNSGSTLQNWEKHVTHGAVFDKDRAFFNYVAHPLAGSWYYLIARQAGHTIFESFIYSFMISTFVWEFGFEAPAEIPSIQDLIITPVIGSIVGEASYRIIKKIEANGGKVRGSHALGTAIIWALDPLNKIITGLRDDVVKPYGIPGVRWQIYYGALSTDPYKPQTFFRENEDVRTNTDRAWMFRINIPFKGI